MPKAPGPELLDQGEVRRREGRQTLGDVAHRLHPRSLEPQQARGGNARRNGDERGRGAGREALDPHQNDQHGGADRERGERGLRQVLDQGEQVLAEPALVEVDPQELRHLVED